MPNINQHSGYNSANLRTAMELSLLGSDSGYSPKTTLVAVICYLEHFKYPLIIRLGAEEV